jgi:inositol oxygenase
MPGIISQQPEVPLTEKRDGLALEAIVDAVEDINVKKDQAKKRMEAEMDGASEFDAEKDKSTFRQYEDARYVLFL